MEADHSLKGFSSMLCAHGALSCMMLFPSILSILSKTYSRKGDAVITKTSMFSFPCCCFPAGLLKLLNELD